MTELMIMGSKDEILKRVQDQINFYIENKVNQTFSFEQESQPEETGHNLLNEGQKLRMFLKSMSMYFYMLTPNQAQNEVHKLYQIGRKYLLKLFNQDAKSAGKRDEVASKLLDFLEKLKNKLV